MVNTSKLLYLTCNNTGYVRTTRGTPRHARVVETHPADTQTYVPFSSANTCILNWFYTHFILNSFCPTALDLCLLQLAVYFHLEESLCESICVERIKYTCSRPRWSCLNYLYRLDLHLRFCYLHGAPLVAPIMDLISTKANLLLAGWRHLHNLFLWRQHDYATWVLRMCITAAKLKNYLNCRT